MNAFQATLPYTCVFIDTDWKNFLYAAQKCVASCSDRHEVMDKIRQMWMSQNNPNPVFIGLSVRTIFDLYLTVMNFPIGSEMIVSAINIPDMVHILHHHKLVIVPLDVSIDTTAPKLEHLESLITTKTVGIVFTHIFGKWIDVEPYLEIAKKHKLQFIEDCAEGFCGFNRTGHSDTDLSLFSFGSIKYYTAFGGSVAKVKSAHVYKKMTELYKTYPLQTHSTFLSKVFYCHIAYLLLNCPRIVKPSMFVLRGLGVDYKKHVVGMLRGFPNQLIQKIRKQPCDALVELLYRRLRGFDQVEFNESLVKGNFVADRLPDNVITVGKKADINNYWLFPILVDNPDEVYKALNVLGVDAYRGATQLNLVEPDDPELTEFQSMYPHEAKYLIDHVVYLPVNKTVPYAALDRICKALDVVMSKTNSTLLLPLKKQLPLTAKL